MAAVERREQPAVEKIFLETKLEDIPEGPPCLSCGCQTEKGYLEKHVCWGTNVMITAEHVAGYRCPGDCGIESYSHEAILESLTKARDILLERGDRVGGKALDEAIELRKQIVAEGENLKL